MPPCIYHMCPRHSWVNQTTHTAGAGAGAGMDQNEQQWYKPPTFDQDGGFIHATSDPSMLIDIANHFYATTSDPTEEWIILCIDEALLDSPVVYESAAPVGSIKAYDSDSGQQTFPHIYGPIHPKCVIKILAMERDPKTGTFIQNK